MFIWINICASCVLPGIYSTVETFIAKSCGVIPEHPRDYQSSLSTTNIFSAALQNHKLKWQEYRVSMTKAPLTSNIKVTQLYTKAVVMMRMIQLTICCQTTGAILSPKICLVVDIYMKITMLSNKSKSPGFTPVTIISRAKPPDTPEKNWAQLFKASLA